LGPIIRKVILAGNHRQFVDWCHDNAIDPRRHTPEVINVTHAEGLMGVRLGPLDHLLRVGTWYDRRDIESIVEVLVTRVGPGGKPKGWEWVDEEWEIIVARREAMRRIAELG
jgi:hypothetical protein